MRSASAQELADLLRREKEALLTDWEREVRKISREQNLSTPLLRDHVPVIIDEFIQDLERLASSKEAAKISRIHGEQRQTAGLDVSHIVEEYKLLRACIAEHDSSLLLVASCAMQALRILPKARRERNG